MHKARLGELLKIGNGRNYPILRNTGLYPVYGSGGLMGYTDDFLYDGESVLLPRKGTLNNIQFAYNKFWTVDTVYYSIIKQEKVDPYFLFWHLRSLDLSNLDSGTGVPSMTKSAYEDIEIDIPDINVQRKIAKILSLLDQKAILNGEIINRLEAVARTLYEYWFIQFDFPDESGRPYKTSGGEMVYSEKLKCEIPAGWLVESLYNIATYTNGVASQKYPRSQGDAGLRVIKIREISDGFSSNTDWASSNVPTKVLVENGDVLFSWSATLDVTLWSGGRGVLNQHIFKVTSDVLPKSVYYLQLLDYLHYFKRIANNRKTTMGHITKDHLIQASVVLPPEHMIEQFDNVLAPILNDIVQRSEEIQHLQHTRDFLLPILMNGQVFAKD